MGQLTDPTRGFYHPPEAIQVDVQRGAIGKKTSSATVVAIQAQPTLDIWAFSCMVYEAIAKLPLSAYSCRGKREMSQAELAKIGLWDENSLKKALRHVDDAVARDLLAKLLHPDP